LLCSFARLYPLIQSSKSREELQQLPRIPESFGPRQLHVSGVWRLDDRSAECGEGITIVEGEEELLCHFDDIIASRK
jgi:hypothetical protein